MGKRRGRRWNSCLLWFATSLGALCWTVSCISASDNGDVYRSGNHVPFQQHCTSSSELSRKVILVSTLDGKLSALDVQDEGQLLWSVAADSRPLLSSSISHLEIMHDGVPTRYIPALDGGLYRYDGESIEALPMTAETLLSSSFKLADNTVMIGGKDTLSYGLDPLTGQVRYACGVKGCHVFGEEVQNEEDILVVTRSTQCVRAVDSRTGSEKWNFSVGNHDLNFIKGQRHITSDNSQVDEDEDVSIETCRSQDEESEGYQFDMNTFANSIKILVPEGKVVGVNPENMQAVTWQYKFKSPVSNVWLLYRGELRQIDMFGNRNIPALSSFESEEQPHSPPLLYVGMHHQQLYVQPSAHMTEKMSKATSKFIADKKSIMCDRADIPRVAWKPYLNTAQWRTPTMNNRHREITQEQKDESDTEKEGALTIWHENYPFDNGFYLYPEFTLALSLINSSEEGDQSTTREGNQPVPPQHKPSVLDEILPVTLWNWWKEVVAISVITSVLVHLLLTRVQRQHLTMVASEASLNQSNSASNISNKSDENAIEPVAPSRQNSDEQEYKSRFETDFEQIQVLGKGGFGVVFETMNKVDECHYAVKRIALPNSDGAKEKVMREVKALAKLDHVGIVRYFHAWIESPPAGWQEERDQHMEASECLSSPTPQSRFDTKTQNTNHVSNNHSEILLKPANNQQDLLKLANLNNNVPRTPSSPMDFLQNPFGVNLIEMSESEIKRGGSEEFSIRSQSCWSTEEDDESGSFSCGMGTPNLSNFPQNRSVDIEFGLGDEDSEDIVQSDSLSNIPSNENTDSVYDVKLQSSVAIEDTNESFQIMFEDSGCGDKSSKGSCEDVCIGIQSSQSGAISESCDHSLANKNSKPKTHSRSHSRSLSKDFATKLTCINEKEPEKDQKPCDKVGDICPASPKLYLYIQMQLCKRETLKDWLSSNTLNRDRHTVLDIFDQISCAIEYVHDSGLMHRDLKPSNIFFSLDGVVKMGDFGLVTALPEEHCEEIAQADNPYRKHTAQVGTQLYMSPEQTSGKVYCQKVDIFSLGVILLELLYPFSTQMERVTTLIKVKQQVFPERFCREMQRECDFVRKLLSPKPEDRPTVREILASELLKDFEGRRLPKRFRTRTISQNSN